MAIPLFKKIQIIHMDLNLRLSRSWRAAAEPWFGWWSTWIFCNCTVCNVYLWMWNQNTIRFTSQSKLVEFVQHDISIVHVDFMTLLLLGCCKTFACTLIKRCSKLAKIALPPPHPFPFLRTNLWCTSIENVSCRPFWFVLNRICNPCCKIFPYPGLSDIQYNFFSIFEFQKYERKT